MEDFLALSFGIVLALFFGSLCMGWLVPGSVDGLREGDPIPFFIPE